MTRRGLWVATVAAGSGAFVLDAWPILVVGWAAASGTVGDLPEAWFVAVGVAVAGTIGLLVGWAVRRALERSSRSPALGRLDLWGAYALGLGVQSLVLVTLGPGVFFGLLLTDENRSLAEQGGALLAAWVATHVAAAVLGLLAGRALLGRRLAA